MKTFQDGDPLFGAMMHAIANLWPNGTAVLSGCAPTGSGSARQVTVAGGTVVINGTVVSISQQTKTLDAATFDRYDLVSINTSGQAIVTKGVDTRRVPPVPANSVPIAICLVETGATTLPADRIYDARMDALRVSALTIDADKNWNGKAITNMGYIESVRIRPVASETQIRWGPKSGAQTVTVPPAYGPGTAWISATANFSYGRFPTFQIVIAGNVVYSEQIRSTKTVSGVYSIKGGDSISITLTGGDGTLSNCKIGVADEAPLIFPAGVWPE